MPLNILDQFSYDPKRVPFFVKDGVKYAGTEDEPMFDDENNIIKYDDYIQNVGQFQDITSKNVADLGMMTSGTGSILNAMNMSQESPDVGTGILSGAMQGFGQFGLLGALGGGAFGGINAGMQAGQNQQQEFDRNQQMYADATVAPRSFDLGGLVNELVAQNKIPIQAEKGDSGKEAIFMPNLELVETQATESHEQMDDEEITDVLPDGSYVFSASEDRKVDLSQIADSILTMSLGHYSESGEEYESEVITIGDKLGEEGEFTYSEVADKVKKEYPVMLEDERDIFNTDTNESNKEGRMPLIQFLIMDQEQSGDEGDNMVTQPLQQMKHGGKPKKYQGAPGRTGRVGIDEYLGELPGLQAEFRQGQGYVYNPVNPTYSNRGATPPQEINMTGGLSPTTYPTWGPNRTTQMMEMLIGRDRPEQERLFFNQMGVDAMNPYEDSPQTVEQQLEGYIPEQTTQENDLVDFSGYEQQLEDLAIENQARQEQSLRESDRLFGRQRGRNLLSTAMQTAGILGQPTDIETPTKSTRFARDMFPTVSRTDIETQKNQLRKQVPQLLDYLEQSGVRGTELASILGPTQAKVLDAERQIEQRAKEFNKQQDAKYFEQLQQAEDFNRGQAASEANRETDLRRQQIGALTQAGQRAVDAAGELDVDRIGRENQIRRSANDNRMNLLLASQELQGLKNRLNLSEQQFNDLMDNISQSLNTGQ